MNEQVINDSCVHFLEQKGLNRGIDLTFLDPPFNQHKDYAFHDDSMDSHAYWQMIATISKHSFEEYPTRWGYVFYAKGKEYGVCSPSVARDGMDPPKPYHLEKKTSAVPVSGRYGKHYQIIAYATKGEKAKTFHRLRIDPPLPAHYKQKRTHGMYVTDTWDDIRELTSGYFAGHEAIRKNGGDRFHKQQAPIALLLRIILSSTEVGDRVFDPFAGTGTTLVVAKQLQRHSIGVEIDPENVKCIKERLASMREEDRVASKYHYYAHTKDLQKIWGASDTSPSDTSPSVDNHPPHSYSHVFQTKL